MNILLTGGCGFIGTHTAVAFENAGHRVILADNFANSKYEAVKRVRSLVGREVPFYKMDFTDKAAVETLFEKEAIDCVVHFAGLKAVGESVSKPLEYYRNNLDSTLTLLEVMKEHGVKKLIFSSSATVYGQPETCPISEEMPVGDCSNPYGRTKYMIEEILRDLVVADPSFTAVSLRYFNPIGAHESGLLLEDPNGIPNNLMPLVLRAATGKLPCLSVFGSDYPTPDGTCIRDYIHVCDLAEGHVRAAEFALSSAGGFEAINLGTGIGYSVLDVISTFVSVNHAELPYKIADRRPGDIAAVYSDPSKAKRLLGWEAKRGLKEMCRDSYYAAMKNPDGYPEGEE